MANGLGPPDYSLLHKASVSFEYLHTNSTTHVFVFGAIAELVDNARDANAKTLNIDFDEKNEYLSFHDDGVGMSPEEMMRVVTFGHSLKKHEHDKIGQYGNGLKSGAMRAAKDFIIFTKKGDFCSSLLLSRTFHEKTGIKDILVPTPILTAQDMKPAEPCDTHKHTMEMNLIYQYSPFKCQREFLAQFDKIKGPQGTIVVLFNLRRIENGSFELDFQSDKFDIQLTDHERETEEERNSLRAYLSVLYMNPYTKIYLRGKKVNTVRILGTLTNTYYYLYAAKNLKSCAEKEHKACERRAIEVEEELKQTKSEYGVLMQDFRQKSGGDVIGRQALSKQRLLNMKICNLEKLLKECKTKEIEARKAKTKPAPLKFSFGLNVHHRNRYGCMVYNNGRLIDMYVKLPIQKETKDIFMKCLGVVGVVDISYSILEPTHNKQSFENKREYQHLLRSMNEHMEQYWDDISNIVGRSPTDVKRFWQNLGYEDCLWGSECSNRDADKVKRYQKTNHCIQCNMCLKWRMVPFQRSYVDRGIPDSWSCANHPNTASRSCDMSENLTDLVVLKKGTLNPKRKNMKPVEQIKASPSSTLIPANEIKREAARRPPPRDPSPSPPPPARSQRPRSQKPTVADVNSDDDEEEDEVPEVMRKSARGAPSVTKREPVEVSSGRRKARNGPITENESIDRLMRTANRLLASPKKKTARRRRVSSSDESEEEEEERPKVKLNISKRTADRAAATKRNAVEESDEHEEVDESVPPKRAKTKADMRRQMEAENGQPEVASPAGSATGSVRSVSSRQPDVASSMELLNKAKRQLRNMLRKLFSLTGSAELGELLKKSDDELLEEDLEQAMVNFNNSAIQPAIRQLHHDKLAQKKLRDVYKTNEMLVVDVEIILNWLHQNDDDRPVINSETAFVAFREFVDQLRDLEYQQVQDGIGEGIEGQREEPPLGEEGEEAAMLVEHPLV